MSAAARESFQQLIAGITAEIADRPLDAALAADLNARHGAGSETYRQVFEACRAAVAEGWMCEREGGGIRYGRVIKPTPALHGFSVDVVDMQDIAGPHHEHPNGEIDLLMPLEGEATFDGQPAGWIVYGPGSAHRPTVRQGRALVLYLLPEGAIRFTGRE
ncbi:DUF4863 family protein [Caldimonas sp. KR1-144]|uniref:4-hydroxylaminobenzoate lyase n=1 Tax=Caldimonas sp. KR1-144 TaxID=3400911 RepID=UPI003C090C1A